MTNKILESKLGEEMKEFEMKRRAELEKEFANPSLEQEFSNCISEFRAKEKELFKDLESVIDKLRDNSEKYGIPTEIYLEGIANTKYFPKTFSKWEKLDSKFLYQFDIYSLDYYDGYYGDNGYWSSSMVC